MADIKAKYVASSAVTVTALNAGTASSATWTAGWESPIIDNSSNLYLDYLVSGKIVMGNSATAGEVRIYIAAMNDDAEWPAPLDGTESEPEDFSVAVLRDSALILGKSFATRADPGADDTYYFAPFSVASLFGGVCPEKFIIFLTHNTGVDLAATNEIHVKGYYETVA